MRKALIILISVAFTGALLVYTAQANLNLLTTVYPNPQFVGFGMLALEGGVVYWEGYYLLHWNGSHKGIAVFMCGLDFVISMIGFFMDINLQAGNAIHTSLFPPVIILISADVCLNVGMGLLVHYLPDGVQQGKSVPQSHAQTGNVIPPPRQKTDAQLLEEMKNNPMYAAWFNWMETQRGEPARPLASRNQPKEAPANLENTNQTSALLNNPPVQPLKQLPPMKNSQQTGLLQEGTGVLVDSVKSLFSRKQSGSN